MLQIEDVTVRYGDTEVAAAGDEDAGDVDLSWMVGRHHEVGPARLARDRPGYDAGLDIARARLARELSE